jgi:DNA topoisomerase-1
MGSKLVIVESPAKARTIGGFLGAGFVVESSIGHVRDLPGSAAEVPARYKGTSWARLGVDVDNDFKPLYVVPRGKKPQIDKLKRLLADADELYLATDEDREGESIAWHLAEVLNPRVPVRRMVFHEITREAIRRALAEPRDIDRRLVDAQEARRILDRLFGYEVSPVLWKMIRPKLSAGRVQSPAIRIVVQRELDRMRFRSAGYWDIEGTFAGRKAESVRFGATLVAVDGARVATGRDFDEAGNPAAGGVVVLDEAAATGLAGELGSADFQVRTVERKPYRRSPYAPFRTATLQQEAGHKLHFSSQRTMQVAQRLYENGYITYMRTDSTSLSESAVVAARDLISSLYGHDYLSPSPRVYRSKVKNAQEAHEAIRPAGEAFRSPDQVGREVSIDEARLYDLIWKRTVASQMADAVGSSVSVRLGARTASGRDAEFGASGKVISFPGFLRAYVEGSDDPEAELEDQERRLPDLTPGDPVDALSLEAQGHQTKPPARFTEASLVKYLEELGIGRPSTYAAIIATIQERGYVWKKGTALVPTFTAFATVRLLESSFAELVDYAFTARMEDDLDRIAEGVQEVVPYLTDFYRGDGHTGLLDLVSRALESADPREINAIEVGGGETPLVVRVGRYGPYLQTASGSVSIPDDLPPDELTAEKLEALAQDAGSERVVGVDPATGLEVLGLKGRFGPYVQLGRAEKKGHKPRTSSLLASMSVDTVTLEEALRLLALPRVVGTDPETGEEIMARTGRFGPYIERGKETRSLDSEEQLFTVTLEEACRRLAAPKERRQPRAAPVLRLLESGSGGGAPIEIREGRFGLYVTDGVLNASLGRHDSVEAMTPGRAQELLQARREKLEAGGGKPAPARSRARAPLKRKAPLRRRPPAASAGE